MIDHMLPRDLDDIYGPGAENADDGIDGESKHTPGPWEAHFWDILDNRTLEPTGKKRMTIEYQVFPDVKVGRALAELCFENEANARLIAAAPDLLEACKFALSVQREQKAVDLSEKMNIERLEAAIAKAKGEQS